MRGSCLEAGATLDTRNETWLDTSERYIKQRIGSVRPDHQLKAFRTPVYMEELLILWNTYAR